MNPILLTIGSSLDSIFYNFDYAIFNFFGSMQNTFLNYVAKFFTTLGDSNFVIPMAVLGVVLMFFKKTRKYGFALTFAILVGTLITNVAVKPLVLRIRPYNTLQADSAYWGWYTFAGALSESDYSFPSGHTTAAFEMATALFLTFRSDGKKKIAWIFPVIALCTMGSRVYLMVHYASDVLGGLIVGIVAGIAGYYIMKLLMKLLRDVKALNAVDRFDLGTLIKVKSKNFDQTIIGGLLIAIYVVVIFLVTFIPLLSSGGSEAERCSYNVEYDCYNEAKDEYELDGEHYCKIHFNELTELDETE